MIDFRQKLVNALLGTKVPDMDTVDISGVNTSNPYFAENEPQVNMATVQTPDRMGGILPDMARGYRENYNTPISINNLGQNKGWAQRIGEGLGTVGRIVDSPLGRGLITAGLIGAMGGEGGQALTYGLTAGVGRQQAKAANDLYRKSLEEQGLDTSNIGGNVTDKMYQNYALANYRNRSLDARMQLGMLKDNTSRAKMINAMLTNGMISPAEAMERMAEYGIKIDNLDESNQTKLLPYRQYALQVAPQIAMGNLGVAQGNLALNTQKLEHQIEQDKNKPNEKEELVKNTLDKLGVLMDMHKKLPQNKAGAGAKFGTAKTIGALNALGIQSDDMAAYDGAANLVTNLIMRKIAEEKGVATDKDFARAKAMTPQISDTPGQAQNKVRAIYALMGMPYKESNNAGTTKSGVKYKVVE